jgi:hypothetical protein
MLFFTAVAFSIVAKVVIDPFLSPIRQQLQNAVIMMGGNLPIHPGVRSLNIFLIMLYFDQGENIDRCRPTAIGSNQLFQMTAGLALGQQKGSRGSGFQGGPSK